MGQCRGFLPINGATFSSTEASILSMFSAFFSVYMLCFFGSAVVPISFCTEVRSFPSSPFFFPSLVSSLFLYRWRIKGIRNMGRNAAFWNQENANTNTVYLDWEDINTEWGEELRCTWFFCLLFVRLG